MRPTCRSPIELLESIQVELRGMYSEERVQELDNYTRTTNWVRVLGVIVLTPLPCLIVTLQIDALPLANPSEGIGPNKWFFLREYYAYIVMTSLVILQFRTGLRLLPYPNGRVVRDTLVVAALSVAILYGLAVVIGFPLPFTTLTVIPAWTTLIIIGMTFQWAKLARETPGAGRMIFGMFKLWMCDMALAFTYPPYFYIFTTLSNEAQMVFTVLLPMIKMFMRNIFARAVNHFGDEIPQIVVFNADVFGSLFIAYCMQSSPSFWTTLEIMVADFVMMGFALRDIGRARTGLTELEQRIDSKLVGYNPFGPTNFTDLQHRSRTTLERASRILGQIQSKKGPQSLLRPELKRELTALRKGLKIRASETPGSSHTDTKLALASQHLRIVSTIFGRDRVHPIGPLRTSATASAERIQVGGRLPRIPVQVRYTLMVRRLLYMAEFIILINYVEVIIPFVFSIYLLATFHLPNRAYYAVFDGVDQAELVQTLKNVMIYCLLQLLSLLVLVFVLKRLLGLSPIRLLAFVLEKQIAWVQMDLTFWLFYNVQGSLQHLGYDYSFQFAWLSSSSDTTEKVFKP